MSNNMPHRPDEPCLPPTAQHAEGRTDDSSQSCQETGPIHEPGLLWCEMRRRWASGERVGVREYLSNGRVSRSDQQLLLDVIYAEICLRRQYGETANASEYTEQFPELAPALLRQMAVDAAIAPEAAAGKSMGGDVAASDNSQPPEAIGKYRIVGELATGGQATGLSRYPSRSPPRGRHQAVEARRAARAQRPGPPGARRTCSCLARSPQYRARLRPRLPREPALPGDRARCWRPSGGGTAAPAVDAARCRCGHR